MQYQCLPISFLHLKLVKFSLQKATNFRHKIMTQEAKLSLG